MDRREAVADAAIEPERAAGPAVWRTWRMTDSDIAFVLGKFANITEDQDAVEAQAPSEATSVADGLSARSARRLRRVE